MDYKDEHKDFIERCKKMCEQAGPQMPQIVCNTCYNLGYWIREYDTHQEEEDSRKVLLDAIGEMWIGLMCLMFYYGLDFNQLDQHIQEQIGH